MKKQFFCAAGTLAILLMSGLVLAGCPTGGGGGGGDSGTSPTYMTFTGTDDNSSKQVVIKIAGTPDAAKAVHKPQNGNAYTVRLGNDIVDRGTITISGTTITFKSSMGNAQFKIIKDDSGYIVQGTIAETIQISGALTVYDGSPVAGNITGRVILQNPQDGFKAAVEVTINGGRPVYYVSHGIVSDDGSFSIPVSSSELQEFFTNGTHSVNLSLVCFSETSPSIVYGIVKRNVGSVTVSNGAITGGGNLGDIGPFNLEKVTLSGTISLDFTNLNNDNVTPTKIVLALRTPDADVFYVGNTTLTVQEDEQEWSMPFPANHGNLTSVRINVNAVTSNGSRTYRYESNGATVTIAATGNTEDLSLNSITLTR